MLSALVVLLLLGQPLLCIVHCRMSAQPAHHSTPSLHDPITFFLCDLPESTVAQDVFVLAFWPGLFIALALIVAALKLVARFLAATPPQRLRLATAPLTPPPR